MVRLPYFYKFSTKRTFGFSSWPAGMHLHINRLDIGFTRYPFRFVWYMNAPWSTPCCGGRETMCREEEVNYEYYIDEVLDRNKYIL